MKIFYISQIEAYNDYDYYESAVVLAKSEEEARHVHPDGWANTNSDAWWEDKDHNHFSAWTYPENVRAREIGVPNQKTIDETKGKVILSTFIGR